MTPLPCVPPAPALDTLHACVTSRMREQSIQTIQGASSAIGGTLMSLAAAAPGVRAGMRTVGSIHEAAGGCCAVTRWMGPGSKGLPAWAHEPGCPNYNRLRDLLDPPC